MYNKSSALAQYKKINSESEVEGASPHRLIQMLMAGAVDRMEQARAALTENRIADKGLLIGKTISIIGGLQAALDKSAGGELAENLDRLYSYMQQRLLEANIHNDVKSLDEVSGLLVTVKSSWDEIANNS